MPKTIVAGALWMLPVSLCAQWLNYLEPAVPHLKDGKLNLSAPAPRTADRKPDLTGVWMREPTPTAELNRLMCREDSLLKAQEIYAHRRQEFTGSDSGEN